LIDKNRLSRDEVRSKMEHYCAYQERCHQDVVQKLRSFAIPQQEKDEIIVALIESNYLNEERFARAFVKGKHSQKKWGKTRLKFELKKREISNYLIEKALYEIDLDEYDATFNLLSEKIWLSTSESNAMKKRKKCADFLLRKGYESDKVYAKLMSLEK